jgi:hypothetical protein
LILDLDITNVVPEFLMFGYANRWANQIYNPIAFPSRMPRNDYFIKKEVDSLNLQNLAYRP